MVTIYACKIEGQNGIYYWKNESDESIEIGDYVIVANNEGYSLVEVVGKVVCLEENAILFSRAKYENMKNIIIKVDMDGILKRFEEKILEKYTTRLGDRK